MSSDNAAVVSGATILLEALVAQGVDTVFGYPGGAIMPTYDALYDFRDRIHHILVRHEQAAAHAAEGFARITGRPGVALATSGPGATNLVTGIADAMLDSVPIVCITGQVAKRALGTDAFQETDVIGITIPITKWNYQITSADEVPFIIAKAFHVASSGRPGPVLIDITKNAQVEEVPRPSTYSFPPSSLVKTKSLLPKEVDLVMVQKGADVINRAKRPMILAGHGVLIARATKELKEFAEKTSIPVALTLHGLSAFPTAHPLYVGMLGMHGNYGPNLLTNEADVLIAVGMRFDDRVTGEVSSYAPRARVVHIEVDPAELNKVIPVEVPILGDAKAALSKLIPLVAARDHSQWLGEFARCAAIEREKVIDASINPQQGSLKMSEVVARLSDITAGEAVIVADVGQHQMMAARYYKYTRADSWVTSGGLGTMGFALPAAVGVKVGAPERLVVAIIGDGGFQMNPQELGTIAQERLDVKIVILNNSYLGMVRQWQELFFDNRYSFVAMDNPDFVRLGEAYGITSRRVACREELCEALNCMLATKGPYLLEVVVETEQNVFPMVPAGSGVGDVRLE